MDKAVVNPYNELEKFEQVRIVECREFEATIFQFPETEQLKLNFDLNLFD